MSRRGFAAVLAALLLALSLGSLAQPNGQALAVRWAQLPAEVGVEALAQHAGAFRAAEAAAVALPATPAGYHGWIEVLIDAPAGSRSVALVMDRVALRDLRLWTDAQGGEASAPRDFFQPAAGELLPARFAFALPRDAARVWLRFDAPVAQRASLGLMSGGELARADRAAAASAAATYAAMLATLLASLALTIAVHEGSFRFFTAFAAAFGLFVAAGDGHLFELPGGATLAVLGMKPALMFGLWSAAASLALSTRMLAMATHAEVAARSLDRLALAVVALGLVAIALPSSALATATPIVATLIGLLSLLPLLLSVWRWSLGSRFAAVLCLLWAGCLAVMAARVGVLAGWIAPVDSLRMFHQLGGALVVVGLSVALTDRVIELRRRVEQIQQAHAESSASLQLEQHRRRFAAALKDAAAAAVAVGDLEWKAFRLLMQAVGELVPNRAIGLTATGYRGFDYLLAEPMSGKARLCGVLGERAATVKSVCRSRAPLQVPFDVTEPGKEGARVPFAVVPLAVPRPGWGALLIEREAGLEFSSAELSIAAEFADIAISAIEEGALKADLRRGAEVDPLTGLLNRRTGEARLEALLTASQAGQQGLTLLFVDFDKFKPINDRHGVAVGDQCLRAVADAVRPLLGKDDLIVRYGGDEFVVALPGQNEERGFQVGERIRAETAALRIKTDAGLVKMTVSIGVAGALDSDSLARLIDRAERASGIAKGRGRNQVQRVASATGEGPEKPLIL